MNDCFVALDFETAASAADSACSIGLVTVAGGKVVDKNHFLIRPPQPLFTFSFIHGITWAMVKDQPSFGELWPKIKTILDEADFIAAHNASFDKRVLEACCRSAGVSSGERNFVCTVQLARKTWRVHPTRLPNVCEHLGIELNHHDALSDAEACARIVLASRKAAPAAQLQEA